MVNLLRTAQGIINSVMGKTSKDDKKKPAKQLIKDIESEVNEEANLRQGYERSWFISLAAILGHQDLNFNDTTRKFDSPPVPTTKRHITDNQVLTKGYQPRLETVLSYDPRAFVSPNSNETLDIEASTLGTKICQGLTDKLKIKYRKIERCGWQFGCGTVYEHPFWNPQIGEEITEPKEAGETDVVAGELEAEVPTETEPEAESNKGLFTGDVDKDIIPPFELFPLDGPKNMAECRRMVWARFCDITTIKDKWPKAKDITSEDDNSSRRSYIRMLDDMNLTGAYGLSTKKDKNKAMLYRYWERPNKKLPEGRYIVWCQDTVLEEGSIPDVKLGKEFEMPFIKYDDFPVVGRWFGQARVEQMFPIGKANNKNLSQIVEHKDAQGVGGKIFVADGSVADQAITNRAAEVVKVDMNKPNAFPPYNLTPTSTIADTKWLDEKFGKVQADLGSSHEVSMAQTPSGVKSGVAISALQEADAKTFGPLLIQESEGKKQEYTMYLKLIHEYYTEKRMLKVAGDDKMPEIVAFMGSDLNNNTDVWVETDDFMPQSRAGKQALVFDFFEAGMLGNKDNDETRKRALQMIRVGNLEEMFDDAGEDYKQARWENREMSKGIPVPWFEENPPEGLKPQPLPERQFENHEAHFVTHRRDIINPLFWRKSPEVRALYIAHAKQHQDIQIPPTPEERLVKEDKLGGGAAPGAGQPVEQEALPAEGVV